MFQTDQSTAASSLPTPAAAATPGFFTGGNPASGTPATILDADFMNMVMMELVNVVVAGGLTPSKTTYDQVLGALRALFAGINGNSAETFSVAAAAAASQAVNLGQLSAVLSPNGYVTFPVIVAGVKQNCILQWLNGVSASTGIVTQAWPVTFPNNVLSAVPVYVSNGAALAANTATMSTNTTDSTCVVNVATSSGAAVVSANVKVIAVGW
ncbi:gp53-like domain-containing protein [Paraburkholderia sediminicola]|uniref:gp53-like domain-containing protein n=1 Tax=Paraburkholderia sediminicola TaxID=458836 RepID=UPI0038BCA9D0